MRGEDSNFKLLLLVNKIQGWRLKSTIENIKIFKRSKIEKIDIEIIFEKSIIEKFLKIEIEKKIFDFCSALQFSCSLKIRELPFF